MGARFVPSASSCSTRRLTSWSSGICEGWGTNVSWVFGEACSACRCFLICFEIISEPDAHSCLVCEFPSDQRTSLLQSPCLSTHPSCAVPVLPLGSCLAASELKSQSVSPTDDLCSWRRDARSSRLRRSSSRRCFFFRISAFLSASACGEGGDGDKCEEMGGGEK